MFVKYYINYIYVYIYVASMTDGATVRQVGNLVS